MRKMHQSTTYTTQSLVWHYDIGVRSTGVVRKLDLSCMESVYMINSIDREAQLFLLNAPLLDLYSMIVVKGKFNARRIVSLKG